MTEGKSNQSLKQSISGCLFEEKVIDG